MNDRFKFRYFYKPLKIMYEFQEKDYLYEFAEKENYALMQCTGLKDKNGKLIYEGDIVLNNCGQWIIKYCEECKSFQCFDEKYGCYACEGDYFWADFLEDLERTTIEGNIYENEELLCN